MNVMQSKVNAGVLTYHCGLQMWCGCGAMLNACEALSVDLSKDGKLLTTVAICAKCYDSKRGKLRAAAKSMGQTLEVIDGRSLSSEARMVEWKVHFTIGKRERFLMKVSERVPAGKRGWRKLVSHEGAWGRPLRFTDSADMSELARQQEWMLHGSKKSWKVTHAKTGLKLCSSTSVAGVIQRAFAILSAQTDEKLTKAFQK